jgi:hypothetical protein
MKEAIIAFHHGMETEMRTVLVCGEFNPSIFQVNGMQKNSANSAALFKIMEDGETFEKICNMTTDEFEHLYAMELNNEEN